MIEFLVTVLISVSIVVSLFLLCLNRPPIWVDKLPEDKSWKKIQKVSLIGAIIISLACVPFPVNLPLWMKVTLAVSTSVLSYMFIQSLYTDPLLRLVDRKSFFAANLIAIASTGVFLFYSQNQMLLVLTVVCSLISMSLILLPIGMGQSDGRAFLMLSIIDIPFINLNGFIHALEAVIVLFVLYCLKIILFSRERTSFKEKIVRIVESKVSLPAVPMILGPSVFVFIYYSINSYIIFFK